MDSNIFTLGKAKPYYFGMKLSDCNEISRTSFRNMCVIDDVLPSTDKNYLNLVLGCLHEHNLFSNIETSYASIAMVTDPNALKTHPLDGIMRFNYGEQRALVTYSTTETSYVLVQVLYLKNYLTKEAAEDFNGLFAKLLIKQENVQKYKNVLNLLYTFWLENDGKLTLDMFTFKDNRNKLGMIDVLNLKIYRDHECTFGLKVGSDQINLHFKLVDEKVGYQIDII